MTTLSSRSSTLSANTFGSKSADDIISMIDPADDVSIELGTSYRLDLLTAIEVVCVLSRRPRQISLKLPASLSPGLADSLARSFLGPLLWDTGVPRSTVVSSDDLARRVPAYVDRERSQFCVSTSLLDCKTRESFQADLGKWMVAAKMVIDDTVYQRIAALTYEANANAEEHGGVRLTESQLYDTRPVFRCFAVRLHNDPGSAFSTRARAYLDDYSTHFSKRTRWLEVVVADAGMGLAFPRYLLRARALHSATTNVYEDSFYSELGQFDEILSKKVSTKGFWGRAHSTSSAIGEGTTLIRRNIAHLRAYGEVRAGRCSASASCSAAVMTERLSRSIEYVTDPQERPLYLGTSWHFLVPLDQQLQMSF